MWTKLNNVTEQPRHAAKVLLAVPDGTYVLIAGKRGQYNLPGGRIDRGETAIQALYRENQEELGLAAGGLRNVRELFSQQGRITPSEGPTELSRWTVFAADLAVPVTELRIPDDCENKTFITRTPAQCLALSNMTDLARQAVMVGLQCGIQTVHHNG